MIGRNASAGRSLITGKLKKISREQLLCLLVAALLAGLSAYLAHDRSFLKDGSDIARGEPGSIDRQYTLNVEGLGERKEQISVVVSAREYTPEEAEAEIASIMEELALHIIGKNENLAHVSTDLQLMKTIPGHGGVRLSWYPDDPGLISYEGRVYNLELSEPRNSSLRVILKAGETREEFALPVTVYPAELRSEADLREKLDSEIRDADAEQIFSSSLALPKQVGDRAVSYEVPANNGWIGILAVGILACALLGLKPEQDRRQRLKKRENELLLDYSDVVSKLVIYMGAGMTARNAWIRITENYADALRRGSGSPRVVYEEMQKTGRELEKGVPESRAFSDFAGRCALNCYVKLVSLLEQNRRTGDPRSENALLLEAQEAFEQRKNTARRLGEEAGTKLMLPLMISLITVMVIVAVPAMLTLA